MTQEELEEQLSEFVEHRKSIKRPMSAVAIKRLRARAERFLARGVDLVECFDRAILSGWQSIYPPEQTSKPQSHKMATLPNYGETTDRDTARSNIHQLIQRAGGGVRTK